MAIVVDASVAAAWCFRDEFGSDQADAVIARIANETSIVPGIFWDEMRNVLIVAERKGRIETKSADAYLGQLRQLPFVTDQSQDDGKTLSLARRHNLSGYDAAYLETAQRHGAELATLDDKLGQAVAEEGASFQKQPTV